MLQAGEGEAAAEAGRRAGSPPSPVARARLETLRRQAARACLGAGAGADRPVPAGRLAQPPVAVPPLPLPPPRPLAPPQASQPLPPLKPVEPPPTLTGCDATGCWASDGTRLQQVGPALLGPRGFCHAQGALLQCPP